MRIDRINNWLTLLGNAGIIISIIFLAYQINEANRVSNAQAFQSRAQMGAEITWAIADSEHIAAIMEKVYGRDITPDMRALDDLQPLESIRWYMFERAAITLYENNLYQCEEGFLDVEFCDIVRAIVAERTPYWDVALGGEIPSAFHRVKRAGATKRGMQE